MAKEHWLLERLKTGIGQKTEANTSRYVHEVLQHCFGWPFERIEPQASKRGFIDYKLCHEDGTHVHVEVKPIDIRLKEDMVSKYLRRQRDNFDVGILTNLREWQIYIAGRRVKRLTGESMYQIHQDKIQRREHINRLSLLIGYRATADQSALFQQFTAQPDVLRYLLKTNESVIHAVRHRFRERAPWAQVPNINTMSRHMERVVANREIIGLDLTLQKHLKAAIASASVAEAAHQQLTKICGTAAGQRQLLKAIRSILEPS